MKLIAKGTIHTAPGVLVGPGAEFEVDDKEAKGLIEGGFAEKKTRVVDESGDEATAKTGAEISGPASGDTKADTVVVASAAKGSKTGTA